MICSYQVAAAPTSVDRLIAQGLLTESHLPPAGIQAWAHLEHTCMHSLGHRSKAKAQYCRTAEVGFAKMVSNCIKVWFKEWEVRVIYVN